MGRAFIVVLAVSGLAVCGALATGPGLAAARPAAGAVRPSALGAVRPASSAAAPAAPRWGTAQQLPGLAALDSDSSAAGWTVSCSSPGNCAVGGSYGDGGVNDSSTDSAFVADQRKGSWGRAIEVPGLAVLNVGENAAVNAVSCTSASDCAAGGTYWPGGADAGGVNPALDAFVATEKDGTWGGAAQLRGLAALNTGHEAMVSSISCRAGGNCAVGGDYTAASGAQQAFVADESAGTWQPAEEVPGTGALNVNGLAGVTSVSCAAPGDCGATGTYASSAGGAFVASESRGTWRAAEAIADGVAAGSVSCASAGNCVAGGSYAAGGQAFQAFVVTETNGVWGHAEQVPGITGLTATDVAAVNAVSCLSPQACTAVGSYGDGSVFVVSTQASTATAIRSPLERCGAIVARSMTMTAERGDGHTHLSELSRWDQAFPGGDTKLAQPADPAAALADLLVAAVEAAVLAPEPELRRWFSWSWYWTPALVDDLVRDARLRRLDGYVGADLHWSANGDVRRKGRPPRWTLTRSASRTRSRTFPRTCGSRRSRSA